MKSVIANWVPVVLWCALIFWLSSIPNLRLSDQGLADFILRKSAHVGEYTILSLLLYKAIGQNDWSRWRWQLAMVALVVAWVYAASDEIHQAFIATRHAAIIDWLIDGSGVLLGQLIAAWIVWWKRVLRAEEGLGLEERSGDKILES